MSKSPDKRPMGNMREKSSQRLFLGICKKEKRPMLYSTGRIDTLFQERKVPSALLFEKFPKLLISKFALLAF